MGGSCTCWAEQGEPWLISQATSRAQQVSLVSLTITTCDASLSIFVGQQLRVDYLQASLAAAAALSAAVEQQRGASPDATSSTLHARSGDCSSVLEALRGRRRLIFTQAPPECTEGVMRAWFGRFGAVEGVQVYGDPAQPPCSGLITLATPTAAAAALAALHDASSPPPTPISKLCVRWLLQPDGAAAHGTCAAGMGAAPTAAAAADAGSDGSLAAPALVASANRTVFFAKVPPSALASEVELLFGSFGKLQEVNLFRAWAGAKHSKVRVACVACALATTTVRLTSSLLGAAGTNTQHSPCVCLPLGGVLVCVLRAVA